VVVSGVVGVIVAAKLKEIKKTKNTPIIKIFFIKKISP
jgi:predicted nucleic acid-binding protein